MHGFHLVVMTLGGIRSIRDTQCGFKLFGRRSAQQVFGCLHVERWAFDLELLYVALSVYRTPVAEVAVRWQEIDGSKINLAAAAVEMLRDIVRIRLAYMFGFWDVSDERQ